MPKAIVHIFIQHQYRQCPSPLVRSSATLSNNICYLVSATSQETHRQRPTLGLLSNPQPFSHPNSRTAGWPTDDISFHRNSPQVRSVYRSMDGSESPANEPYYPAIFACFGLVAYEEERLVVGLPSHDLAARYGYCDC